MTKHDTDSHFNGRNMIKMRIFHFFFIVSCGPLLCWVGLRRPMNYCKLFALFVGPLFSLFLSPESAKCATDKQKYNKIIESGKITSSSTGVSTGANAWNSIGTMTMNASNTAIWINSYARSAQHIHIVCNRLSPKMNYILFIDLCGRSRTSTVPPMFMKHDRIWTLVSRTFSLVAFIHSFLLYSNALTKVGMSHAPALIPDAKWH